MPEGGNIYYIKPDTRVTVNYLPCVRTYQARGSPDNGVDEGRATLRLKAFSTSAESERETLEQLVSSVGLLPKE
jgi:hypothetical protein